MATSINYLISSASIAARISIRSMRLIAAGKASHA